MITKIKNITDKTLVIPTLKSDTDSPRHVIGRMISSGVIDDISAEYNQRQIAAAQLTIIDYIARGWLEEVQ